ncbi:MAG: oligosaccharide flippase family protein [Actinomycetota bacterium]|nr:oligosaccharide flippase family protein [Actinomycetota bacterium]
MEGGTTSEDTAEGLTGAGVGDRAIRGGTLRIVGYGIGLVATAGASVVLLRDLSVAAFGRFTVVSALLAIVTALSDAGLTAIGQRAYVRAESPEERRSIMRGLLGLRIALTPLVAAVAVGFSIIAGYTTDQILATVIGSAALVLTNAAMTLVLPQSVRMNLGRVTVVDVTRQIVLMIGLAALAAAGASFVILFFAYIASGIATVVAAIAVSDSEDRIVPSFDPALWRTMGRAAIPLVLGSAINVVYLRLLVILVSLMATAHVTGIFGASFRIVEIFTSIPQLMAGAIFPLLAHAGQEDESRLAYILQRTAEASLLLGAGTAVALSLAAHPVLQILGGSQYSHSGTILSLQAFALIGTFLTQIWVFGLIAVDRQRAIAQVNAVGVGVVVILGLTLIPLAGARGAAVAAIAGEAALALTALVLLVRARPRLRPAPGHFVRILSATALATLCSLLPVPEIVRASIAVIVYAAVVIALRAYPPELLQAFGISRPRT